LVETSESASPFRKEHRHRIGAITNEQETDRQGGIGHRRLTRHGAATAKALAEEGADVAISYVTSAAKAEAVVRELESHGVRAAAFQADQADSAQAGKLIEQVVERFGRLNILVNNAGVAAGGPIDDAGNDLAALDRQYAINFTAVVTAIRAAAKVMSEGDRIITIGSNLATRVGFTGLADYSATKAAVVGYTKGAARDLGPRGSR